MRNDFNEQVKGSYMDWDKIEKNWAEYQNYIKSNWLKLTKGQLNQINGKRNNLLRALKDAYGWNDDESELQLLEWENNFLGEGTQSMDSSLNLNQQLIDSQYSRENVIEKDEVIDSPFHKGY